MTTHDTMIIFKYFFTMYFLSLYSYNDNSLKIDTNYPLS
jgi:hypothetical protein